MYSILETKVLEEQRYLNSKGKAIDRSREIRNVKRQKNRVSKAFVCIRGLCSFSWRTSSFSALFSFPIFKPIRYTIDTRDASPLKAPRFHATGMPPPPYFKWPLSFLPSVSKLSKFPFEKVCSGSRRDRTHPSLDYIYIYICLPFPKTLVGKSIFLSRDSFLLE